MQRENFNGHIIYYASPEYLFNLSHKESIVDKEYYKLYDSVVEKLKDSISEKGFLIEKKQGDDSGYPNIPVVEIDSLGYLFLSDGNHRVKAAKRLGLEKIPFIFNVCLADSQTESINLVIASSQLECLKHVCDKYPELKNDDTITEMMSTVAYGQCEKATKVCDKKFIQENLIPADRDIFLDNTHVLPNDFLEKTTFQFL